MVNLIVIPQIYTIVAYGFSVYLWALIPQVPLPEGIPFYLIHPYFTAELFLMISTLIVWAIALIVSLIYSLKQGISITRNVSQNLFATLLVFITIIAAISGCIFFSTQVVYYPESIGDFGVSPPNPLAAINSLGILFSEAAWIILGAAKIFKKGNISGPEAI